MVVKSYEPKLSLPGVRIAGERYNTLYQYIATYEPEMQQIQLVLKIAVKARSSTFSDRERTCSHLQTNDTACMQGAVGAAAAVRKASCFQRLLSVVLFRVFA